MSKKFSCGKTQDTKFKKPFRDFGFFCKNSHVWDIFYPVLGFLHVSSWQL